MAQERRENDGHPSTRNRSRHVEPPTAIINGQSTASDWRRICLDRQLPAARFPAGISVPMLVCAFCLVLLAALTVWSLRGEVARRVSGAVAESQQQLVVAVAHDMQVSSDRARAELRLAAARYAADPRHDPAGLVARIPVGGLAGWRGVTVVDPTDQSVVATRGEPLDLTRARVAPIAGAAPYVSTDGYPELQVVQPINGGQVLVGVRGLSIRPLQLNAAARQALLVAVGTGNVTHSQGAPEVERDPETAALITRALQAGHGTSAAQVSGAITAGQPAAGTTPGYSAPLVTTAPVGSLGASVVSVVDAPTTGPDSPWRGVPAALLLLALVGLILAALWLALTRPLLRLVGQAKEIACGEPPRPAALSRVREVARIKRALDESTAALRGSAHTSTRRWTVPAVLAPAFASVAVIAWSGMVMVSPHGTEHTVPQQVVADTQNQIEDTAAAVRDVLDDGVQRLTPLAVGTPPADATLRRTLLTDAREARFRSAYLLDSKGEVSYRAGRVPLRQAGPLTGAGLVLDDKTGRVPVLYAHARMPDGRSVVLEYDLNYLSSLLHNANGHLRLADGRLRTVLDTTGFVAFDPLSGTAVRRAASASLAGRSSSAVVPVNGIPSLVSAAPVAAQLTRVKLAVLAERNISDFPLAGNELRRRAWLVALVGVCLGLLLFGWQFFVVVRPLRILAATADRLAGGDNEHVISPLRHDEIGAIAVCLDICRQAQRYGDDRFAGAMRLRGKGSDYTLVLPPIPGLRRAPTTTRLGSSRRADAARRRGTG